MGLPVVFFCGFVTVLPTAAFASPPRCELRGRPWLEGRDGPGLGARAVDARAGETIDVFLVMPGKLDGRAVIFADDGARGHRSWSAAGCAPVEVGWRRVEPRMTHTTTPAPNPDVAVYANAVVFGPHHGEWIGYDRLEYFDAPIAATPGALTLSVRDATPSLPSPSLRSAAHAGLGTMRLAAIVRTADGMLHATPGATDLSDGAISSAVFRYSFRADDSFLGWLTSFYNVPYLFGSAGKGTRNQAERYVGADCADILVAALRRAGHRELDYSSVGGLVSSLTAVAGPALVDPGAPGSSLPLVRFGVEVRPGDILAIDYVGVDQLPRDWDHIVTLVEDRGPGGAPDGVLGPEDIVADSGDSSGLKFAPLGEQGRVRVAVLRARGPLRM